MPWWTLFCLFRHDDYIWVSTNLNCHGLYWLEKGFDLLSRVLAGWAFSVFSGINYEVNPAGMNVFIPPWTVQLFMRVCVLYYGGHAWLHQSQVGKGQHVHVKLFPIDTSCPVPGLMYGVPLDDIAMFCGGQQVSQLGVSGTQSFL